MLWAALVLAYPQVQLRFSPQFHQRWVQGLRFNVRFSISRSTFVFMQARGRRGYPAPPQLPGRWGAPPAHVCAQQHMSSSARVDASDGAGAGWWNHPQQICSERVEQASACQRVCPRVGRRRR